MGKEVSLLDLDSLPFEDLLQPQVVQAYLEPALKLLDPLVKQAQIVTSSPSTS